MPYGTSSKPKRTGSITSLIAALTLAFVFTPATADSPSDPKRVAFEVVDRNADQIATVGDVLYYYAEPGMQEHESAKFVKETLERAGFTVELGGAGMPTNVWAKWGSGKPVIALLPPGAKPPVDLNKDIMDKYRPAIKKFYLNKKAEFK